MPGRRSTILYSPLPPVVVVRLPSINAGLDASTVTPGMTLPDGSLTIPAIAPRFCASIGLTLTRKNTTAIMRLGIVIFPFSRASRVCCLGACILDTLSKHQLRCQLQLPRRSGIPRRIARPQDQVERRRAEGVESRVRARLAEVGMVENIEGIHTDLPHQMFGDSGILHLCDIDIGKAGTDYHVPPQVSELIARSSVATRVTRHA